MLRRLPAIGLVPIALCVPTAAGAESASATIAVSLVVEPACRVSATPMDFAGRAGEALGAASQIEVACNGDTAVAVRLDGGANPDALRRRLAGTSGHVEYAVHADAARTQPWAPGQALSGTAGIRPLVLTAHGSIAAGATLAGAGLYRDTITVTVDF